VAGSGDPVTAAEPKRVLFVFGSLERAGGQLRTLELCDELRRRYPIEFDFCVLGLGPIELQEEIARLDSSIHVTALRSPRFFSQFSSLLRSGRYDVVHSRPRLWTGLVLWLAARQRVPMRVAMFGNALGDPEKAPSRSRVVRRIQSSTAFTWVMRSLIRRYATHVIGVSRDALDSVFPPSWQSGRDCRVINYGYPLSRFQEAADGDGVRAEFGWPADSRIIVNVARFSPQKNHRVVLEATRLVYEQDQRVRLLLVGRGRLGDVVDRLIDETGVREICATTGGRTDVPRLLLASDVFFLPSLWEGLPGAVMEALAAGLPVVASDIRPVLEIAQFFPDAVLTAPPNDSAKHAENLRAALELTRDRVSAQARFAGTPFELEKSVEVYGSFYGVDHVTG
jgi:glycosyltransferase involved in cell wall biosynthesis